MSDQDIHEMQRRLIILESMIIDIYDATVKQKRVCPICENEIRLYLPNPRKLFLKNQECPCCRSHQRNRTLWLYLRDHTDLFDGNKNIALLHFAPERWLHEKFSSLANVNYYPVDINADLYKEMLRKVVDIQHITYDDRMFDYIICNHVLEHAEDDLLAMRELHRVLKPRGVAYIMVPLKWNMATTVESDLFNTTRQLRLQYYGDENHVRLYGSDFSDRLKSAGFEVTLLDPNAAFSDEEKDMHGLNLYHKIFQCVRVER